MLKSFPNIIKDYISPYHLEKFHSLLARRIDVHRSPNCLDLGDHLLYFNPVSDELDRDGYYSYQTPSAILNEPDLHYRRRLWAQGEINAISPMDLNQEYLCRENLKFIKKIRNDYYVRIEREMLDNRGHLITQELRTLVYTNSMPDDQRFPTGPNLASPPIGAFRFKDTDIISYGNLSLNPHRIHWDRNYCRQKEGYSEIIVPGPFSVLVLIKIAKNHFRKPFTKMKYKNIQHIYPDTQVEVYCENALTAANNVYHLWMRDANSHKIYLNVDLIC